MRVGLSSAAAWKAARDLADRDGALAYRFDENGRIAEVYAREPEVLSVSVSRREAVTDTGLRCQITNLFNAAGAETDDDDAIAAVAKLDDHHWFSIDLTQFETVRVN